MIGLRRHAWLVIVLAALMAVIMLFGRIGRRSRSARPRMPPAAEQATPPAPAPAPAPIGRVVIPRAPVVVRDAGTAPVATTAAAPAPPASPSVNIVAQQMRATDAADRTLLVAFERAGAAWPEPVVHDLIAMRRRGASAAELEHAITSRLAGNIPAQVAARRWLREQSSDRATPHAAGAHPALGSGGAARRVTGVQPKPEL